MRHIALKGKGRITYSRGLLYKTIQVSHFVCRRKSPPAAGDFRRQPKCETCICCSRKVPNWVVFIKFQNTVVPTKFQNSDVLTKFQNPLSIMLIISHQGHFQAQKAQTQIRRISPTLNSPPRRRYHRTGPCLRCPPQLTECCPDMIKDISSEISTILHATWDRVGSRVGADQLDRWRIPSDNENVVVTAVCRGKFDSD